MLSGGVSGMTISHSDIGGYTFAILPETMRSRELLIRWLEMSTFTSILRTHEGSNPALNAQFYDDEGKWYLFSSPSKAYCFKEFIYS